MPYSIFLPSVDAPVRIWVLYRKYRYVGYQQRLIALTKKNFFRNGFSIMFSTRRVAFSFEIKPFWRK